MTGGGAVCNDAGGFCRGSYPVEHAAVLGVGGGPGSGVPCCGDDSVGHFLIAVYPVNKSGTSC